MPALADLLTGSAARQALARRAIAEVFRMLRDAGVSQASIALATGQRQSEVSEILSGRQVQSVALLERIADGLGVPRGWMGLAYAAGAEPTPVTTEDLDTEQELSANLLRHAGMVLYGKPVFGAADPILIEDTPTPTPRRIGLRDVSQVTATTERFGQLARDLGGIPMTGALTVHATASEALLSADMGDHVRQLLLVELADAHRAAGSAAASAGLRDLARQHYSRGMECAGAGGDLVRAVLNLDGLGRLELRVEPNEALKLFQLGSAAAPTPLTRALLDYGSACALGLLGLKEEALAGLRRARDSYQAAGDEPRLLRHFASTLPHIEGFTYFALGRFDRAAPAFSAAVEGAGHAVACTVDNSGLLAAAQLRSGDVGSGLHTAQQVIRLAKGLRSVSALARLAPLQEAAAARRDSACQDLAREVAMLRRAA